jgi:hypothetical protein
LPLAFLYRETRICGHIPKGVVMAFNMDTHIKDHAHTVIDGLQGGETDYVHFTCSIDTALMIVQGFDTQEKIDRVFVDMLNEIVNMELKVVEKNGTYTTKNGDRIQKYRNRIIKFEQLLAAYHNRHFDASKSVNPHLHFLGNKNIRLGKNFTYLKKALKKVAEKRGLVFHFDDRQKETGLSKMQEKTLKKMSWIMNEGNPSKIKSYVESDKLAECLDLLNTHYSHTQNISYYLKIMNIVTQRLDEASIDFTYDEVNLRNEIYFLLTDRQVDVLDKLKCNKHVNLYMDEVFDREICKYAYGFRSSAFEILAERFDISHIDMDKLTIHVNEGNRSKFYKSGEFYDLVKDDVKYAVNHAMDEKSMKNILYEMGYEHVAIKTTKQKNGPRQKTGLTLTTAKKMKMVIPFSDLGLSWSEITYVMIKNKKKKSKKIEETQKSKINDYKRRKSSIDEEFSIYTYRKKRLLCIYYKEIKNRLDYSIVRELAHRYEIQTSELYNITTFSNNDTTIVDYHDKVVLKKGLSLQDNVSDMLLIAEMKGWDLNKVKIEGSIEFVNEAKRQINKRSREVKYGNRLKLR